MTATTTLSGLEIPPPLPRRPIQWRRAHTMLREVLDDPSQTDAVFELFDAVGGRGDEKSFLRFAGDSEGDRMLREKPDLAETLTRSAALPEGSFGRAYADYAERNGFAPDDLSRLADSKLPNDQLDVHRRWFFQRVAPIHDLWHVLSGYDTDEAGEAQLLAFSLAQGFANRAFWVLIVAAGVMAPWRDGFAFQRQLLEAWRRGRHARRLFVLPYEDLLPLPLDEVRSRLDIAPLQAAHPRGLLRGSRATGVRLEAW
jgi:ubiquinone biosynthesis protein COQ4